MRILVDLLGYTGGRGGTETYVRELLPRLAEEMPDADFVALTGASGAAGVRKFFPGEVRVVEWVGDGRASWAAGEIVAVERTAKAMDADLVWSPANFGPLSEGVVPRVVSVHDVIYHEVPGEGLERLARAVTAWLMTRTARTARAVVTVSATAASAIHEHLGVPRERITVVHNGGSDIRGVDDPWRLLAPLGILPGRPVLLSTGNRMPHKNFAGLLAAVARIPADQRPLTVIGGGGADDPLRQTVERLGLAADVVLPGWVSDDQLRALYQVADVYACPSLTEGFGLPSSTPSAREYRSWPTTPRCCVKSAASGRATPTRPTPPCSPGRSSPSCRSTTASARRCARAGGSGRVASAGRLPPSPSRSCCVAPPRGGTAVAEPASLRSRLFGFTLIPAVAAVSPLVVLPAVSRAAPDGWSSAIAGESIGTFAAIAVAYGWTTVGPALVSIAADDVRRGRLYRDALVVRLATSIVALPALVVVCALVASPGYGLLAALMGLQGP